MRLQTRLIPLLLALTGLTVLSCSAARSEMAAPQYEERYEAEQPAAYAQSESTASRGSYARGDAVLAAEPMRAPAPQPRVAAVPVSMSSKKAYEFSDSSLGGSANAKTSQHSQPTPPQPPTQQQEAKHAPSVIYQGYLKLRVRRTLEAIDAATKAAIEGGGYVQMQSASTLIVRMPATDFDAAMLKFANLGEVLQRQIQAVDVTKQVTDLDARLAVAVQSRARLLELLKTVKDVEERLQILEEIKRLTEQIETMQSSLATLRNLTNYFTITIDFESLVAAGAVTSHASPFDWVRNLVAHRVTLNDGHEKVHMALPAGFVRFDDSWVLFGDTGAWRAQASDTSMLRAAYVPNDPKGDALFWAKAVEFEMDGRDEALVESSRQGKLEVRVFKNKDAKPRWWLIGTMAVDDRAWVVEAFFPDEAAYKAHAAAVLSALTTFGTD